MSVLFGRSYKLTIDDTEIEGGGVGTALLGLDIKFKVETTTKKDPNKIDVDVYNLNPSHRAELLKQSGSQVSKSTRKPVPVVLEAGYADDRGVIFRGELRNLTGKTDGSDKTITLSGSDSGHMFNVADIQKSFAPGTRIFTVVQACANAMGVGLGNLSKFSNLTIPDIGTTFSEGYSLSGSAEIALDGLLFSAGLAWSVQKGVLQVRKSHEPVDDDCYQLSADTGLIGTPEPEIDATVIPTTSGAPKNPIGAKRTGLIKVRTLLIHQLYPGAKIDLQSDTFKGGFQITQVIYTGDSAGDEWYCDLLVRPY